MVWIQDKPHRGLHNIEAMKEKVREGGGGRCEDKESGEIRVVPLN